MRIQTIAIGIPLFFHIVCEAVEQTFLAKLAEKIWKNECGGKREELTHWNNGEEFASLGIGHFIWYPKDKKDRFQETFPHLIRFLQTEKVALPDWMQTIQSCPWNNRDEFYRDFHSKNMKQLREILFETRDIQAKFIVTCFETAFTKAIQVSHEKERIIKIFEILKNDPRGMYAVIDYVNFKGMGISPEERYNNEGWGLVQILEKMPLDSKEPVADFVKIAKEVLQTRIRNSPPERNEKRWLQGWENRINTYIEPI